MSSGNHALDRARKMDPMLAARVNLTLPDGTVQYTNLRSLFTDHLTYHYVAVLMGNGLKTIVITDDEGTTKFERVS